jgi:hypothetical protein
MWCGNSTPPITCQSLLWPRESWQLVWLLLEKTPGKFSLNFFFGLLDFSSCLISPSLGTILTSFSHLKPRKSCPLKLMFWRQSWTSIRLRWRPSVRHSKGRKRLSMSRWLRWKSRGKLPSRRPWRRWMPWRRSTMVFWVLFVFFCLQISPSVDLFFVA